MAQSTTNIRMSVDTSQAKSQVSSFNDEMQKMNGLLKEATDSGDFRGAANLTAAINQLQQAQRSLNQQINEANRAQKAGMAGISGGVTGFVSGAGGIASALGNGSIGGAASGSARMAGNALSGAGSALTSASAGGLGKILGYLGLGSLALGAGIGAVTNLSDKYQETLPDMAEFIRFSGGKETDWYHQATKYTQGTTMSQMDLVRLATEQAQYGLYGTDAMKRAQTMGIVSYNTGIDTGTLTRLQGISDRFGLNENAIGNSLAGFYQSGLKDGRQQEFFDGVLRVMEEGINAGFVRSSEDVAKNLAMLSELSGNNPAWQGQYGAQKMSQINSGFANATNLQSVTDVMLFDAAKGLYSGANATGTYIDQMMVLERGLDNPELLKNFYNSVNDAEGDNLAAKIERFRQASGLNYTGAYELYELTERYNASNGLMSEEEYNKQAKAIMTNPNHESDLQKQVSAMNKLSDAMINIEQKAFNVEMSTASGAGAAIVKIQEVLERVFTDPEPTEQTKTYQEIMDDIPEESVLGKVNTVLSFPKEAELGKLTHNGKNLYSRLMNADNDGNDNLDEWVKAMLGQTGLYKNPQKMADAINFLSTDSTMRNYYNSYDGRVNQEYINDFVDALVNKLSQAGITLSE